MSSAALRHETAALLKISVGLDCVSVNPRTFVVAAASASTFSVVIVIVGVEAPESPPREEFRRTRRMPTRAFRVGVASYSSSTQEDARLCVGVASYSSSTQAEAEGRGVDV